MPNTPPNVLIESWLPFAAIGAESQRERGASSALPPLYFLHVWWARRPLTVSRAAILAGLLPQWSADWPEPLRAKFPTEEDYRAWFTRLVGILGDPVAARKKIAHEKTSGIRTPGNKYGYPRAFTHGPSPEDLELLLQLLETAWGMREVAVMDPMAGGGSIPFEALRYGFTTYANELNPVASVILKATLDYPGRFGPDLTKDIRKWGERWYELVKPKLDSFFAAPPGQPRRTIYMWARTVTCPSTGKLVPLSPNWWIKKGKDPIAVRLLTDPAWEKPRFEVVNDDAINFDPDEGTVKRGVGRSPWTGEAIDGDYIKQEAQAGRMGQMPYCVEVQTSKGRDYVPPTEFDMEVFRRAEGALQENLPRWEAAGLVPREPFPEESTDPRPLHYGMPTWADMFSPRQLLSLVTFLETLREVRAEMREEMDETRAAAVETYLGIMMDKTAAYNCRSSRWHSGRTVVAPQFERHDFSFKWSHSEFDASANLLPWGLDQITDAYKGIADLVTPNQASLWTVSTGLSTLERLQITQGSATDLSDMSDDSVHHICVDPPYYDNVMYAELSDFFYVWLKRSVGHLYPEFFRDALTDKDSEAVANPARFKALTPGGKRPKDLARRDYERKMAACFREMARVLHPDGVLTVMFTHKQVEAWDTLAAALIGAGFTIRASWPVHTESEHSLHQAQKNAAASTILLVCRKRAPTPTPPPRSGEGPGKGAVWWDDIRGRVRQEARKAATKFIQQGVTGVDLYISTFGPALSVISEHWPVLTSEVDERTGEPKPLRPEVALDLAREEVIALRKRGLLRGREVEFDPVTDWYLMAWDAFRALEFPADEARKLALALGLDVEADLVKGKQVVRKKGGSVVLQRPAQRQRRGLVEPDAVIFETWLDAAHTAMLVYDEDGAAACEAFLKRAGLLTDATLKDVLQTMINAIPRTQVEGEFVRPEAATLDKLRLALFEDLTVPTEDEPLAQAEQLGLFGEEM